MGCQIDRYAALKDPPSRGDCVPALRGKGLAGTPCLLLGFDRNHYYKLLLQIRFSGSRQYWQVRIVDMPKTPKSDQPMSFESALSELERIVAGMESGELSLEQSLAAHKRGRELGQYCQNLLAQAQQQVKILEENTLKNFPGGESDG